MGFMKHQVKDVSSFEAKTHLSEILTQVEKGEEYTVTRRGKPVARILPFRGDVSFDSVATCSLAKAIRKTVKKPVAIRDYIEEGRRV